MRTLSLTVNLAIPRTLIGLSRRYDIEKKSHSGQNEIFCLHDKINRAIWIYENPEIFLSMLYGLNDDLTKPYKKISLQKIIQKLTISHGPGKWAENLFDTQSQLKFRC